jgi:hypothetical protein
VSLSERLFGQVLRRERRDDGRHSNADAAGNVDATSRLPNRITDDHTRARQRQCDADADDRNAGADCAARRRLDRLQRVRTRDYNRAQHEYRCDFLFVVFDRSMTLWYISFVYEQIEAESEGADEQQRYVHTQRHLQDDAPLQGSRRYNALLTFVCLALSLCLCVCVCVWRIDNGTKQRLTMILSNAQTQVSLARATMRLAYRARQATTTRSNTLYGLTCVSLRFIYRGFFVLKQETLTITLDGFVPCGCGVTQTLSRLTSAFARRSVPFLFRKISFNDFNAMRTNRHF